MKQHKKSYGLINNIVYLLKYAWRWDKKLYALCFVKSFVSFVLPFAIVLFPKYILDELTGERNVTSLVILLAGFLIVLIIFRYADTLLVSRINPRITMIRFKFIAMHSSKSMEMDFEKTEDSNVLNRVFMSSKSISGGQDGIEGMYKRFFAFFGQIITFLGYISIILFLNLYLLIYLVLSCIIVYFLGIKLNKAQYENEEMLSETDRKTNYISGILNDVTYGKEIRLFNIREWIMDKYKNLINERINVARKIRKKHFMLGLLNIFLLLIREGIIYIYLAFSFIRGSITIGDFTMYFVLTNNFTGQLQGILDSIAYMNAQNLYINDFRLYIEQEDYITHGDNIEIPKAPYVIEFKHVSFKYPNSENFIIKNFSYKFESKKRIAIVGHNGAGKTTLIKLITRLYTATEGEITLNGININLFKKEEYYKLFSALYQDFKIFGFSIYENISLTEDENTNMEIIDKKIEEVGLSERISTMPESKNTKLLKVLDFGGIELSGGENQRIALARALYKDGSVFIMDEPTAAMDALAEYNFYQMLNNMVSESKIYIFISHRLASTRFCDEILMMENGKILENGTHEQLLEKRGHYYEMFELQAQNYREEVAL